MGAKAFEIKPTRSRGESDFQYIYFKSASEIHFLGL